MARLAQGKRNDKRRLIMAVQRNCNCCGKQNTCPKAKRIENYRLDGCLDHEWPDGTILCPECGSPMEYIQFYHYEKPYGQMTTGDVYHCDECGNDDVIERRWEKIEEVRRRYFHG
jgi:hypothetical protein